jgi:hypothetical protein
LRNWPRGPFPTKASPIHTPPAPIDPNEPEPAKPIYNPEAPGSTCPPACVEPGKCKLNQDTIDSKKDKIAEIEKNIADELAKEQYNNDKLRAYEKDLCRYYKSCPDKHKDFVLLECEKKLKYEDNKDIEKDIKEDIKEDFNTY